MTALRSMTGFARADGETEALSFVWEMRSVNGKGLDLRLRLPSGFEALEGEVRRLVAARLTRGNVQANLQVKRAAEAVVFNVNEAHLARLLRLSGQLVENGQATLPSADGLLALPGVVEAIRDGENGIGEAGERAVMASFVRCLDALVATRGDEGGALGAVLMARIDEIAALARRAERDEAHGQTAIRERLARQVEQLLEANASLDRERIAQEAAILATRADIREELDRLHAHVEAGRRLLTGGGAVGRRLDFLAQEFNRETNTICAKSNAASLTAIGLDLKVVVDQFREQVQNIE